MLSLLRPGWKSDAGLLFTVLVWGVNFAVVKAALAVMHPHAMNAFRFTVSVAVLGALYAWQVRRTGRPFLAPLRAHGRSIFALGLLGYLFYQLCFIVGIDRTSAGNAALIMASAPLWTALLGFAFKLEVLSRTSWLGLLLSLAGTAVVVAAGTGPIRFGSEALVGNGLMLAASVLWGAYTAFNKPVLSRGVSATALTFLGLLFALPFLYGIAIPYWGSIRWDEVDAWVWLAIGFSGGLSTGLVVVIWNGAIQRTGSSNTAVYGNLVPLVAVVAGVVLLDERIAVGQIVGGALIIGGLVVMRRGRRGGGRREEGKKGRGGEEKRGRGVEEENGVNGWSGKNGKERELTAKS